MHEHHARLAAAFAKRRTDRSDPEELVRENLAELEAVGALPGRGVLAEDVALVRAVAGGCGLTAFALATVLGEAGPAASRGWRGAACRAAAHLGLAEQAYETAVSSVRHRAREETDPARLPGTQFAVAGMRARLATMAALLTRPGSTGIEDEAARGWAAFLHLTEEARDVVSATFDVAAGSDRETTERLGRIWHDLKADPAPLIPDLARELLGKSVLGIDPARTPRWL